VLTLLGLLAAAAVGFIGVAVLTVAVFGSDHGRAPIRYDDID
jgi:hypothetical protein